MATDITATGAQDYRQLQAQNQAGKEETQMPEEQQLTPEEIEEKEQKNAEFQNLMARTYAAPEASTAYLSTAETEVVSPLKQGSDYDYWGRSMWDDQVADESQFQHLGDVRANNQWGIAKLGAGVVKGAITAGTTFVNGTVGLLVGAATAIGEQRWSGLWDNGITKAMDAVNEWSERDLAPNYYTEEEQNAAWYENAFSGDWHRLANFWGDHFIKNFGFTIGAIYSGGIWSGVGGLIGKGGAKLLGAISKARKVKKGVDALAKCEQSVQAMSGCSDITKMIVGGITAAEGEGAIEAYNNTKDWVKTQNMQLEDEYNRQVAALDEQYAGMSPDDPRMAEYQQRRAELDKGYQEGLQKTQVLARKMGNRILMANIPVLTASNIYVFGRMFTGGFKKEGIQSMIREATTKKAAQDVAQQAQKKGLKSAMKSLGERMHIRSKEAVASQKKAGLRSTISTAEGATEKGAAGAATEAAATGGRAWVEKNGSIGLRHAFKLIKKGFSEGSEEVSQGLIASVTGNYYEDKLYDYYMAKMDPNAEKRATSWINAIGNGIADTLGDRGTGEEFFLGALTGMLGIPSFKAYRKSDGSIGHFRMEEGIFGAYRDYRRDSQRVNAAINHINRTMNDPNFRSQYQGVIRHEFYQSRMDEAASQGNQVAYKDAEVAQMISDIQMFKDAGMLEMLKHKLSDEVFGEDEKSLNEIIEMTTSAVKLTEADGTKRHVLKGPFAEFATYQEGENGQPGKIVASVQQDSIEEVRERVRKNKQKMLDQIDSFADAHDAIDHHFGEMLSVEQKNELAYIMGMSDSWRKRIHSIVKPEDSAKSDRNHNLVAMTKPLIQRAIDNKKTDYELKFDTEEKKNSEEGKKAKQEIDSLQEYITAIEESEKANNEHEKVADPMGMAAAAIFLNKNREVQRAVTQLASQEGLTAEDVTDFMIDALDAHEMYNNLSEFEIKLAMYMADPSLMLDKQEDIIKKLMERANQAGAAEANKGGQEQGQGKGGKGKTEEQQDEDDFNTFKNTQNIGNNKRKAAEEYLKKHPKGKHVQEVQEWLNEHKKQMRKIADNKAYNAFKKINDSEVEKKRAAAEKYLEGIQNDKYDGTHRDEVDQWLKDHPKEEGEGEGKGGQTLRGRKELTINSTNPVLLTLLQKIKDEIKRRKANSEYNGPFFSKQEVTLEELFGLYLDEIDNKFRGKQSIDAEEVREFLFSILRDFAREAFFALDGNKHCKDHYLYPLSTDKSDSVVKALKDFCQSILDRTTDSSTESPSGYCDRSSLNSSEVQERLKELGAEQLAVLQHLDVMATICRLVDDAFKEQPVGDYGPIKPASGKKVIKYGPVSFSSGSDGSFTFLEGDVKSSDAPEMFYVAIYDDGTAEFTINPEWLQKTEKGHAIEQLNMICKVGIVDPNIDFSKMTVTTYGQATKQQDNGWKVTSMPTMEFKKDSDSGTEQAEKEAREKADNEAFFKFNNISEQEATKKATAAKEYLKGMGAKKDGGKYDGKYKAQVQGWLDKYNKTKDNPLQAAVSLNLVNSLKSAVDQLQKEVESLPENLSNGKNNIVKKRLLQLLSKIRQELNNTKVTGKSIIGVINSLQDYKNNIAEAQKRFYITDNNFGSNALQRIDSALNQAGIVIDNNIIDKEYDEDEATVGNVKVIVDSSVSDPNLPYGKTVVRRVNKPYIKINGKPVQTYSIVTAANNDKIGIIDKTLLTKTSFSSLGEVLKAIEAWEVFLNHKGTQKGVNKDNAKMLRVEYDQLADIEKELKDLMSRLKNHTLTIDGLSAFLEMWRNKGLPSVTNKNSIIDAVEKLATAAINSNDGVALQEQLLQASTPSDVSNACQTYLEQYPNGQYRDQVAVLKECAEEIIKSLSLPISSQTEQADAYKSVCNLLKDISNYASRIRRGISGEMESAVSYALTEVLVSEAKKRRDLLEKILNTPTTNPASGNTDNAIGFWPSSVSDWQTDETTKERRPFDRTKDGAIVHIHDYLEQHGAFKYVNSGKLKPGQKVFFVVDPSYLDPDTGRVSRTIFMAVKDNNASNGYQIIGVLSRPVKEYSQTGINKRAQYAGMKQFIEKITNAFTTSPYNSPNHSGLYVYSETSEVATTLTGIIPGSTTQVRVPLIQAANKAGIVTPKIIFKKQAGDIVQFSGKAVDVSKIDFSSTDASGLFVLIPTPGTNGEGYTAIGVNNHRLSKDGFNLLDVDKQQTTVGKALMTAINGLLNGRIQNTSDFLRAAMYINTSASDIAINIGVDSTGRRYITVAPLNSNGQADWQNGKQLHINNSTTADDIINLLQGANNGQGIILNSNRTTINDLFTSGVIYSNKDSLSFEDCTPIVKPIVNGKIQEVDLNSLASMLGSLRGKSLGGGENTVQGEQITLDGATYQIDSQNNVYDENGKPINVSNEIKTCLMVIRAARNATGDQIKDNMVIFHDSKSDKYYVFDRNTGKLLDQDSKEVKNFIEEYTKKKGNHNGAGNAVVNKILNAQSRIEHRANDVDPNASADPNTGRSGTYGVYVIKDETTGETHRYIRYHDLQGKNWYGPDLPSGTTAIDIGNIVDNAVRRILEATWADPNKNVTVPDDVTKPTEMKQGVWDSLIKQIKDFAEQCKSAGWTPYANNIVVFHKYNTPEGPVYVAGEIDILVKDKNGNLILIDIKTSAKKFHENGYDGENLSSKFATASRSVHVSNLQAYTWQLNFYRKLIKDEFGGEVTQMYILPFHNDHGQTNWAQRSISNIESFTLEQMIPIKRDDLMDTWTQNPSRTLIALNPNGNKNNPVASQQTVDISKGQDKNPVVPKLQTPSNRRQIRDHSRHDGNNPFRLVDSRIGTTGTIDLQQELEWLRKALPQLSEQDRVKIVKGLIHARNSGETAWGQVRRGIMYLSDIAATGTVYHEAFHIVFRYMLTQEQQRQVLADAMRLWGDAFSDIELEERLAERFREYVMNKMTGMNEKEEDTSFFSKLGQAVKKFFRMVYNLLFDNGRQRSRMSIESLFRSIDNGAFASKELRPAEQTEGETGEYTSVEEEKANEGTELMSQKIKSTTVIYVSPTVSVGDYVTKSTGFFVISEPMDSKAFANLVKRAEASGKQIIITNPEVMKANKAQVGLYVLDSKHKDKNVDDADITDKRNTLYALDKDGNSATLSQTIQDAVGRKDSWDMLSEEEKEAFGNDSELFKNLPQQIRDSVMNCVAF